MWQVVFANGGAQAPATFTYGYQPGTDLVQSLDSAGAMATQWDYEAAANDPTKYTGRLGRISASSAAGGPYLYAASYGYYDNDQRHGETISRVGADGSPVPDHSVVYEYDALDQLKRVTSTDLASPVNATYGFDAAGNRTDLGAVDALNQYTDPNGANFRYDARGNLTDDTTYAYAYDALDRLTSAEAKDHSARVEFEYDAQGRRTVKRSYSWNSTYSAWVLAKTLTFAYDGDDLVAEFQEQPDHTDKLVRSYAWGVGLGGSGVGGLLAVTDYTADATYPKTYLPFYDGSGNVVGLTDAATGAVAATYEYDAFGKLLASTGPAADVNPFRFSTRYYDVEVGLVHYDFREYSPALRGWLTRDPSGEQGGLNLHTFVNNDPVNSIDPYGLDTIEARRSGGKVRVYWLRRGWGGHSDEVIGTIVPGRDATQPIVRLEIGGAVYGQYVTFKDLKDEAESRTWPNWQGLVDNKRVLVNAADARDLRTGIMARTQQFEEVYAPLGEVTSHQRELSPQEINDVASAAKGLARDGVLQYAGGGPALRPNLSAPITGTVAGAAARAQRAEAAAAEASYIFRADDAFKGGAVGRALGAEADAAEIQTFAQHVLRKESGMTSRFTSFTTETKIAKKFTKAPDYRYITKAEMGALQDLEAKGVIKIWTPDAVYEAMKSGPKKSVRLAGDVRAAMAKNAEILIEGQIPAGVLKPLK